MCSEERMLSKSEFVFFTLIMMRMITTTLNSKTYSAVDLNRARIKNRFRNHTLTRPSLRNDSRTTVAIGIGILEIAGIDAQKQVITLNVNFELKWCDKRLEWNTTEQLCIHRRNRSQIFFTAREIWTPDIEAVNGPAPIDKKFKLQYPILATCSGNVRWSYQEKLKAFCEIDVRSFPFDTQYCSFLLQSTIYDASQMKLRSLYNVVRLYNYINTGWEISHATIEEIDLYNLYHTRDFSTLKIDIALVRFSRFYILTIIFPYCIISSLALFSFCLPTDSGEKMALIVSVLLSLIFYLQLISDYVPKTERGRCTLTLFANIVFFLAFLSCVFNTFTMFIYYREQHPARHRRPKRTNSVLSTMHKSLVEINRQRSAFLKKRRNIRQNLPEQSDIEAVELLHDIRHFRHSLLKVFVRRGSVTLSSANTISLASFDFRQRFLYPHVFNQPRSVKRVAILLDQILFFVYLILLPLAAVFLYKSANQSRLAVLAKINGTNQLLDLRTALTDPRPMFRGCLE